MQKECELVVAAAAAPIPGAHAHVVAASTLCQGWHAVQMRKSCCLLGADRLNGSSHCYLQEALWLRCPAWSLPGMVLVVQGARFVVGVSVRVVRWLFVVGLWRAS